MARFSYNSSLFSSADLPANSSLAVCISVASAMRRELVACRVKSLRNTDVYCV